MIETTGPHDRHLIHWLLGSNSNTGSAQMARRFLFFVLFFLPSRHITLCMCPLTVGFSHALFHPS